MKLENQVAIITGGGRGIGKSTALAFAQEGADLVLAARTPSEIEAVAAEVCALRSPSPCNTNRCNAKIAGGRDGETDARQIRQGRYSCQQRGRRHPQLDS